MIAALPIAAGLLAVLSDEDGTDFEELFRRSLLLDNPGVLFDAMDPGQIEAFLTQLYASTHEILEKEKRREWTTQGEAIELKKRTGRNTREEIAHQLHLFRFFFHGAPLFTVLRATEQQSLRTGSRPEDSLMVVGDTIHYWPNGPLQISELSFPVSPSIREFLESKGTTLMKSRVFSARGNLEDAIFMALRYGMTLMKLDTPQGVFWIVVKTLEGQDVRPRWVEETS